MGKMVVVVVVVVALLLLWLSVLLLLLLLLLFVVVVVVVVVALIGFQVSLILKSRHPDMLEHKRAMRPAAQTGNAWNHKYQPSSFFPRHRRHFSVHFTRSEAAQIT